MPRALVVALLMLAAGVPARAEPAIVLMVGGIEKIIYLPAALAERLGYFRDEGVDVEVRSRPAGVEAEDELLSGAVQGVVGFYDHTIELQAKGKAVESVVQLGLAPGHAVVVARRAAESMKSMADVAGRRLGVTGLGASTNFLSQYLVLDAGARLADVTFVPAGSGDAFIASLVHGVIDAGITTEPTISRLLAANEASVLVDLRTPEAAARVLGGVYPAACLYMETRWVQRHRREVRRIVAALVRALGYIATHDAEAIATQLPATYYAGDRRLYVQALAGSKAIFSRDGVMPAAGPATAMHVLSTIHRGVRGKHIDLAKTYTTEFVDASR